MFSRWIDLALGNFVLVMFALSILCISFYFFNTRKSIFIYEIIYQWIALLPLGIGCLYLFVVHAFFSEYTANKIGWQNSPFQFEVAIAALAFGLFGLLSFRASYGFRLATVIGSTCWLWGTAIGHVYQMLSHQEFSVGNAGSWLWMDVLIPLVLIVCIVKLNPVNKRLFY